MRTVLSEHLSELANHIRAKAGTQSSMTWPDGFLYTIEHIETGGGTSWKTEFAKNLGGQASVLPDDLAALRAYCFYNKPITDAQLADLPNTLTTIGEHCFDGCTSLTAIDLSNKSLQSIGQYAFSGCSNAASLDLSDNDISTIPTGMCAGMSALRTLNLSGNSIGAIPADFIRNIAVTSVDLSGSSITQIGSYAFADCNISTLILPTTPIGKIGEYAFKGLKVAGALTISVEELGNDVFKQCNQLTSIRINNCKKFNAAGCSECSGLQTVEITETPTSFASNIRTYPVFNGSNNITDIYVPWSQGAIPEENFFKSSQNPTWHYDTTF